MPLLEDKGIMTAEATEASTSVERRGNMLVVEVPDHSEGLALYTRGMRGKVSYHLVITMTDTQ